jgi:hypothetical protein
MVAMFPSDPWNVTEPLSGSGPVPAGPPTASSVPSTVPSCGGDEQPANDAPAQCCECRENGQWGPTNGTLRFGHRDHSFRATSGPVIRSRMGKVAAMIAIDAASPPITVVQ